MQSVSLFFLSLRSFPFLPLQIQHVASSILSHLRLLPLFKNLVTLFPLRWPRLLSFYFKVSRLATFISLAILIAVAMKQRIHSSWKLSGRHLWRMSSCLYSSFLPLWDTTPHPTSQNWTSSDAELFAVSSLHWAYRFKTVCLLCALTRKPLGLSYILNCCQILFLCVYLHLSTFHITTKISFYLSVFL